MKQKLMVWSFIAFSSSILTGCAGLMGESMFSGDKGRVLVSADAEGMRAWSDMLTGAAIVAKASPDTIDAHSQLRNQQEITTRQKWALVYAKPVTAEAK